MPASFDAEKLWSETKSMARFSAIALAVVLLAPYVLPHKFAVVVGGLTMIGLALSLWQFVFYGSTLASMKLQGEKRRRFQIAISLAVPALLTFYFVYRAEAINPVGAGLVSSWWVLLAPAVIAFVCYKAREMLHPEHPFRGFLIAAVAIFFFCFLKEQGVYFESDDYDEGSSMYVSEEQAEHVRRTGEYAMRYVLYVSAAYGGLLLGRWRQTRLPF